MSAVNHKYLLSEDLPDMEELDLSSTPFVTDNPGFFKLSLLPSMRILDLSECSLRNADPVCNLTRLTKLNLSHNALRLLPSRLRLALLQDLVELDLRSNRIDASQELAKLDVCPRLTVLRVEGNPVSVTHSPLAAAPATGLRRLLEEIPESPSPEPAFEVDTVRLRLERLDREHAKTREAITRLELRQQQAAERKTEYRACLEKTLAERSTAPDLRRLARLLLRLEDAPDTEPETRESLKAEIGAVEQLLLVGGTQDRHAFWEMSRDREAAKLDTVAGALQEKLENLRMREIRILEKITLAHVMLQTSPMQQRPAAPAAAAPITALCEYEQRLREFLQGERSGVANLVLYQHSLIQRMAEQGQVAEDRDELIQLLTDFAGEKGALEKQRPGVVTRELKPKIDGRFDKFSEYRPRLTRNSPCCVESNSRPEVPSSILAAVDPELQYLNGSAVMEALGNVLEEFMDKELLTAQTATDIAKLAADTLDGEFEENAVAETGLSFGFGEGIANYRYDQGRWEFVVKGPLDLSLLGPNVSLVINTGLLGIDGSGPAIVKGAAKETPVKKGRKRKQPEMQPEEVNEETDEFPE